jgi:hypothetical protein
MQPERDIELAEGAVDPDAWPAALRAVAGEFVYNTAALESVAHNWEHRGRGAARLVVEFTALRPVERLVAGVPIWTAKGVNVTGFGSHARPLKRIAAGTRARLELVIPRLRLNRGVYYPVVAIVDGTEYLYRWPMTPLDVLENDAPLVWGLMTTDYEWRQSERRA